MSIITRDKRTVSDDEWRRYVAGLAPDDKTGAFLLPQEIPNEHWSPQKIRHAISTASRRAFVAGRVEVSDHMQGRIRGTMRVMVPQGADFEIEFKGGLGWRATISVIGAKGKTSTVPVYYHSLCMNPLWIAAYDGGRFDTSSVEFTPLGRGRAVAIRDAAVIRPLFAYSRALLARNYQELRAKRKLGIA